MSVSGRLQLLHHEGRELTVNEVKLQQFFRERDEEHQRQLERKQRNKSVLLDDFFQDSGRSDKLKDEASSAPPSPMQEQEDERQRLRKQQKGIITQEVADSNQAVMKMEDAHEKRVDDKKKKSIYRIAKEQKRQNDQDSTEVADEGVDKIEPPVETSTLIGKRSRKDRDSSSYEEQPVNIPHDELDPSKFPQHQLILKKDWSPSLAASTDENDAERQAKQLEEADGQEGSREFILKDFSLLKNQTLALKITVPADSARWAVNIGPPDPSRLIDDEDENSSHSTEPCDDWRQILFHFNPRYARKKEIVQATLLNGVWTFSSRQTDMSKMRESFPLKNITLIIQVRADGFYTSVNGIFLSIFPHRFDISGYKHLRLQLPIADDNGNPENAIFHKVWWGRRDTSNNFDFIGCSREAIDDRLKKTEEMAKNIYIGGLPYTENLDKLDDLRIFLLDIFNEFDPEPESLELPPGKGFARMRLSSAQNAQRAISSYNHYLVENEDDPNDEFRLIVAHAR